MGLAQASQVYRRNKKLAEKKSTFTNNGSEIAFATIGNSFFSNPHQTITWSPFGVPSIWIWQLFFLGYGIFVMWFLAFYMELSKPVKEETIQKYIN